MFKNYESSTSQLSCVRRYYARAKVRTTGYVDGQNKWQYLSRATRSTCSSFPSLVQDINATNRSFNHVGVEYDAHDSWIYIIL